MIMWQHSGVKPSSNLWMIPRWFPERRKVTKTDFVESLQGKQEREIVNRKAMANHGYCTRCFWQHFDGYCYMLMKFTKPYSYCPDYKSRKRTNESLEKWIKDNNVERV